MATLSSSLSPLARPRARQSLNPALVTSYAVDMTSNVLLLMNLSSVALEEWSLGSRHWVGCV